MHGCQSCLWGVVQELFARFGPISRIYIAYDRETGESRGFAFVNFTYRYAPPCDEALRLWFLVQMSTARQ